MLDLPTLKDLRGMAPNQTTLYKVVQVQFSLSYLKHFINNILSFKKLVSTPVHFIFHVFNLFKRVDKVI